MIVISGALVLVALVLLVVGLLQHPLGFVYASIGVSLAAFGFLIVGIVQRRGEFSGPGDDPAMTPSPSFGAGTPGSNVSTTNPSRGRIDEPAPDTDAPDTVEPEGHLEAPHTGAPAASLDQPYAVPEPPVEGDLGEAAVDRLAGSVLIMPGRPRYHVAGCRYLLGKDAAEVDVRDARDEGFTPCGVCKPDQSLGSSGPGAPSRSNDGPPAAPHLASEGEDDAAGPPA